MARVRLNAGGLSAAQVRMGSRGASERVRPPGDDINSGTGRDGTPACGWCGSTRKVGQGRPRRCAPCRADEQAVREAAARLAAAAQPPLGSKAVGTDYGKIRRQGEQAQARLAERRLARPTPARSAPSPPPPSRGVDRRLTPAQKREGAARLKIRIEKLRDELAALPPADRRRDLLREDLAAARRLLSDWSDGIH